MNLTEKVAYLNGLVEGSDAFEDKKQKKIFAALLDLVADMALTISDLEDEIAELTEQVDEIDEDLALVEEDLYDDEDLDDEDEDDFYEVECPECGEVIYVDEDLLEDDFIVCPNCNEEIEIEFDCDDCDCECGCEVESK